MAFIELSVENFKETLQNNEMLFIHFHSGSDVCVQVQPIFHKIADNFSEVSFATVDITKDTELAEKFGIKKHSTLTMAKDGIVVYQEEDVVLSEDDFMGVITQVKALDMKAIRAELAADKQA
jgi:thioredoxin-like negative regulator of GroEL